MTINWNTSYSWANFIQEFNKTTLSETESEDNKTLLYMRDQLLKVMVYIENGYSSVVIFKTGLQQHYIESYERFLTSANKYHFFLKDENSKDGDSDKKKKYTFKQLIMDCQEWTMKSELVYKPWISMMDQYGNVHIKMCENNDSDKLVFNLFPGYKSKVLMGTKADLSKCSKTLNHVLEVYCQDDKSLFSYVIDMLGEITQNPTQKPGVAIILIGKQGCGKSEVFQAIGECLFGKKYTVVINDIEQVTGKFNAELEGKKVIIGDEVKGFGKDSAKLKNLITSSTIRVEKKGIDSYHVSDTALYCLISNSMEYYKIDEEDRRYLVLECSDKYCRNKEYFNELFQELRSEECGNNLYTYLVNERDISGFNMIRELPMTNTKSIMVEESACPVSKFIQSITIGDVVDIATELNENGDTTMYYYSNLIKKQKKKFNGHIQAKIWQNFFKVWYKKHYNKIDTTSLIKFSRILSKYCERSKSESNCVTFRPNHWTSITDYRVEVLKHTMRDMNMEVPVTTNSIKNTTNEEDELSVITLYDTVDVNHSVPAESLSTLSEPEKNHLRQALMYHSKCYQLQNKLKEITENCDEQFDV